MAATPEGKVKKLVREMLNPYVESHGLYYNMPVPTGYGEPMLDFVGIHRRLGFMIETKAPGEKLKPRQQLTRDRVLAAGGKVFVVGEFANPEGYEYPYSGMKELARWLLNPQ